MEHKIHNLILFIASYVGLAWLLAAYVTNRLFSPTKPGRLKRLSATFSVVFFLITSPTAIILRYLGVENIWIDALFRTGYLSLGFFSFVFTFLVIRDIGWLATSLACWTKKRFYRQSGQDSSEQATNTERRHFLMKSMNIGIMTTAGIFTAYGISEAKQMPSVKKVRIPIPGLPPDLEHFRIVQITDIHLSPTIKRPFLEKVVDTVNTLSADMVALTGDLVDGSVKRLAHDVEPLADIQSKFGNFFVTGNHEYYSEAESWVKKVRTLGFTVLLNEHRIISKGRGTILLAGVTDFMGGQFLPAHVSDPAKAIAGAPPSHAKILLAHQPRSIQNAARAGFDLQISGHTHGGQFFPWYYFVGLNQPYVSGLHRHENTWIYVSRGTGYWGPPVRLGAPSEITVIELVSSVKKTYGL